MMEDAMSRHIRFICLVGMILLLLSSFAFAFRGVAINKKEDLRHRSGKLGPYRALVIGINDYTDPNISDLKTAVHDAVELANILEKRYGFIVTRLLDRQATKQMIMDKLREIAVNATPEESILIYYAGHGDVDKVLNDGWWVPADATGGNPVTYLDNHYVQRVMRSVKARHVLLISDSCYSGTLFGESRSLPMVIDDRYYMNLYNEKSRWGMTSGNKTPVSDSGSENHSIFAYQLIKTLKKNDKPFISAQEIYNSIAPIIANNSEQQPMCRPVRDTGDQGGGFVFVTSRAASLSTSDNPDFTSREDTDRLAREKEALARERQELARAKKELEQQKALDAERERLAAERKSIEAQRQQLAKVAPVSPSVGHGMKREGRYIAYENGTVLDKKTNLMWASKDNQENIHWPGAKYYCEHYTGGGYSDWRLPTKAELEELYAGGAHNHFINITGWVWSSDTRWLAAATCRFHDGKVQYILKNLDDFRYRALPVRSHGSN